MRATNKNLTILSAVEQAALYELPDFNDEQRLSFLNFTQEEQELIYRYPSISAHVHCALQIGFFKAKHFFFKFDWDEVQDDVDFILQEYFHNKKFEPVPITNHQYYRQCKAIAKHFDYTLWSKKYENLLYDEASKILRRDTSPQFIVIELLKFLREKKILRPGYTTLQTIVSQVLNDERERLGNLINKLVPDENKNQLQKILLEEDAKTITGLANLKQSAKDFKPRMISAEIDKTIAIKSLYLLSKSLLPKLNLSLQNTLHYASLIDFHDAYELRKKIKPEKTYLYLLCYISQRYQNLSDNLVDAFCFSLRQCEEELKKKAKEAHAQYAINKQDELDTMKKFARLFINDKLSSQTSFGEVRKKAFHDIMPEEELREKVSTENDRGLKEIDFKWKAVDSCFGRYKSTLRGLAMAMDFSKTVEKSPCFAAVSLLKEIFSSNRRLSRCPISAVPEKTLPKRLRRFLIKKDNKGEQLNADRYEFWIYRQLKKRISSGEIFLEDSVNHRSLQQEINSSRTKESLIEPLNIPALSRPIKQILDGKFSELDKEWAKFNRDFTKGKLKHLEYDETDQTLHLKKTKSNKDEELQKQFYSQLPLRDIAEVLRFVNEPCKYSSTFTHIQPRYTKVVVDENTLDAVIIAQAFNNGNHKMAKISNIAYEFLLDVYQSRFRLQNLKNANDKISDDIAKMPIFPDYSLGLTILFGGVDGQKFEVERPNIKARSSKKYFKKGKGVVAYTLLVNHIPLQTELIGAHEHESYFAFDIWYNNTSSVSPDAITGDMHLINKGNFAIMDWFGGNLCPRFTNIQAQVKHLYCSGDPEKYKGWLIKPVGQIDRQLIEEEWVNIEPIIKALGCKEISQSILIKKLCTYSPSNRTRKAIFEYDKLIRSIYTLQYLQDRKIQREIHKSQNRVESYHQLRAAIATAYGKKSLIGRGEQEVEISNQCGRLVANAIIHYNSSILSKLKLKYEAEGNHEALKILKKISPVAWQHIHFQGHLNFSRTKMINLDEIINNIILNQSKAVSMV